MLTVREVIDLLSAVDPELPFLMRNSQGDLTESVSVGEVVVIAHDWGWLREYSFDTVEQLRAGADWLDEDEKARASLAVVLL